MAELWRLCAADIVALVRARQVSAREVAVDTLERIEAVNHRINAIVDYRPEEILQRAYRLDALLAQGEDPGPLAGVPVSVKINTDQASFATTNGSVLQEHLIAASNSPAVDNLIRAGALLIGRSNSPTFALRWFTDNQVHGKTLNPRDPRLTPGGSSGGGAAAVAAGMGPLALGTDIGGSVRYPAYACGIHGLRPSFGRVPAYNASSPERAIGPQLMSATGPMARTVNDLRLALAALSKHDARDPWHTSVPLTGTPATRRVAVCFRPDGMPIAAEVEAALRNAVLRLKDAGWQVEEREKIPSLTEAASIQEQLWLGDGFEQLLSSVERDGDDGAQAVIRGVRPAVAGLPSDVVARALVRRLTEARKWQTFFVDYAVLLVPVSGELPFPDDLDRQGPEGFRRVWDAQLPMRAFPAVGLPGVVVTTGAVGTTPVGVQLVAARFREDLCLEAASDIEARGERVAIVDPC